MQFKQAIKKLRQYRTKHLDLEEAPTKYQVNFSGDTRKQELMTKLHLPIGEVVMAKPDISQHIRQLCVNLYKADPITKKQERAIAKILQHFRPCLSAEQIDILKKEPTKMNS